VVHDGLVDAVAWRAGGVHDVQLAVGRAASWAGVLAASLLVSCTCTADRVRAPRARVAPARAAQVEPGAMLEHATYELVWNAEHTTQIPDGYRIETPAGYTVDVLHATLISFEIALVPCGPHVAPATAPRPSTSSGTMGFVRDLLGPSVAHAGHSEQADPSALRVPQVEILRGASVTQWGARSFAPRRYCRAHYIVARATTSPDAGNYDTLATLHAEFVVRAPHGGPERHVTGHVPFANGKQIEFADVVEIDPTVSPRTALVRIERDLYGSFCNVDFSSDGREFERSLLRGLMEATRVRVKMHSYSGQ
jgi:hypothetical protein